MTSVWASTSFTRSATSSSGSAGGDPSSLARNHVSSSAHGYHGDVTSSVPGNHSLTTGPPPRRVLGHDVCDPLLVQGHKVVGGAVLLDPAHAPLRSARDGEAGAFPVHLGKDAVLDERSQTLGGDGVHILLARRFREIRLPLPLRSPMQRPVPPVSGDHPVRCALRELGLVVGEHVV